MRGGTAHEGMTSSASIKPPTTGVQTTEPEPTPAPGTRRSPLPTPRSPPTHHPYPRLDHTDAAAARTRVVELGGSAAVNLSTGVTDVVALANGEQNRRMSRITALQLPVHKANWLTSPPATTPGTTPIRPKEPHVTPRGGVIDLPTPSDTPAPTPTPE